VTNLTIIVLSAALVTNASVVEIRSPGFSPTSDRVIVTNVPTAEVTFKVTWEGKELILTNTIPLATNVTKFGWQPMPLREERRPLEKNDLPPSPPGVR